MLGINPVTVNRELSLDKEAFGVELRSKRLEVPLEFRKLLRRYDIRSITTFVSMITAFPTEVSMLLEWSVQDVRRAERELIKLLRRADPDPSEWARLRRPRPGSGGKAYWKP